MTIKIHDLRPAAGANKPKRRVGRGEGGQIIVDIEVQRRLQGRQIDVAGPHHIGGVRVVDQGQQQVFERGVFVPTRIGVADGAVQGFFERTGK